MDISPATSSKIRNLGIVCAFFVVLIHCRPQFETGSFAWYVAQLTENGVAEMAVPFFFVVSGLMLGRKLAAAAGSHGQEVRKRLKTLLVPYFVWNALFWVAQQLVPFALAALAGRAPGPCPIPTHLDFGLWYTGYPALSALWYVRALFLLVLVAPLLLLALEKTRGWALLPLFVLYGVVCPYSPIPPSPLRHFARVGLFPVLGVFYFSLGLAVARGLVDGRRVALNPWLSVAAGLGLLLLRAVMEHAAIPGGWYPGFFSLPFLLWGAWKLVPAGKWPDWLATNAFPVFLLHKFFLGFAERAGLAPPRGLFAYFALACGAFALSLLVANAIRRLSPRCADFLFGGR
jgi:surface polysaccharide O-acyltransferase-like enzyme